MLSEETQAFYDKFKEAHWPVEDDIMECTVCGRKADVLNNGKGPLICCGRSMIKVGEAIDRHHEGETSVAKNYYSESAAAVMGCRAAKNSIGLWQRRASFAKDEARKLQAKRMILKYKRKVLKCKNRGMMI